MFKENNYSKKFIWSWFLFYGTILFPFLKNLFYFVLGYSWLTNNVVIISVQSLCHVWLQHARLSCSLPTPRTFSNSCPLSRWCYPTISSSVIPFSSYLQSFLASGSFLMSQCFPSGCESFRWTAKGLSHTYTCIHSSPNYPSHPGCHKTMNRVPCAIQ